MSETDEPLGELLSSITPAIEGDEVLLGEIVDAMGEGSVAAVLLLIALIMVSPLSGIPGSPTVASILYLLICGQMLVSRKSLWLPERLRCVALPARRVRGALNWLRQPVKWIDPIIRTRLTALADRPLRFAAILLCMGIALIMPVMELLPFASSFASGAIALFAVGLMARDGIFIVLGYATVGVLAALALLIF